MHVMIYNNRRLFVTELNSFVREKKLLTIKYRLRFWFYYIHHQHKIVILIDHQNLNSLKTMKCFSKQLIKWIFEFSEYNLKIKYCKQLEIVVSNVIFKKLNLIKKISINRILSYNTMMNKIDEQE